MGAEAIGSPRVRVAAVTAAASLRMVEIDLVAFVVRVAVAAARLFGVSASKMSGEGDVGRMERRESVDGLEERQALPRANALYLSHTNLAKSRRRSQSPKSCGRDRWFIHVIAEVGY